MIDPSPQRTGQLFLFFTLSFLFFSFSLFLYF